MNVFDFHIHSWMADEIQWVKSFMESGKPVLGICLGAQIIAAAAGCEVYPGKHKEIGWFNLKFLPGMGQYRICEDLPSVRKVFHWHGDTFDIPEGADRIAESQAFPNQGFIYRDTAIALQFHLEVGPDNVRAMIEHCGDEIREGPYMQTSDEILGEDRFFEDNYRIMYRFLSYLEKKSC
jgi:GMP synthase-like glutamine amidotransferase